MSVIVGKGATARKVKAEEPKKATKTTKKITKK